ncbi:MAG: hypothetical protein ACP5P4_15905 [Steroidobacteraceae bacterium]
MKLSTATSALDSRLAPFLFATIREDPEDTPLTVLSVLARRDVDPWEEAERLAQLPREVATGALAGWIAALPNRSHAPRDGGAIAAHLVTLLPPYRARKTAVPGHPLGARQERIGRERVITQALLYLMFIALLLVSQWVMRSHRAAMRASQPVAASTATIPAGSSSPAATTRRKQVP